VSVLLALVFHLLSYYIVFISIHKFPLLFISPPHPAVEGKGRDEQMAV